MGRLFDLAPQEPLEITAILAGIMKKAQGSRPANEGLRGSCLAHELLCQVGYLP
jgi:hypothetical protein